MSTLAQSAKSVFLSEDTFVVAKEYEDICSASPTKKMSWKRSDLPFKMCQVVILEKQKAII